VLILLRLTYITYIIFQIYPKIKFLANLVAGLRGSGDSGNILGDSGFPGNSIPSPEYPDF
jgi:hypothetical protein